jgi:Protein of unknown function (DUF1192)
MGEPVDLGRERATRYARLEIRRLELLERLQVLGHDDVSDRIAVLQQEIERLKAS